VAVGNQREILVSDALSGGLVVFCGAPRRIRSTLGVGFNRIRSTLGVGFSTLGVGFSGSVPDRKRQQAQGQQKT
jgi:hypothetical protein